MPIKYHKLVRDKIPEIIEADGKVANYIKLDDSDMLTHLLTKLNEEFSEVLEAADISKSTGCYASLLEELCDISTVIDAIIPYISNQNSFDNLKNKKNLQRGEFYNKIFLIDVENGV